MNWKNYEHYIFNTFREKFPESKIDFNRHIKGVISGRNRQIDLLIEGSIAGEKLIIVVDCKYFNKKIDIKTVESFLGLVKDVKGNRGILITNKGYTKSAFNRATNDQNSDVKLEIIEFKQLYPFQGPGAIIHRNEGGAVIQAPDGWVVDGKKVHSQTLAAILPYGLSIENAARLREIIFCNITLKSFIPTIQDLLDYQEEGRLEFDKDSTVEVEPITLNRYDERDGIYRLSKYPQGGYFDHSIFLDFEDFIIYIYLVESIKLMGKYFDHLLYIVNNIIPLKVKYQKADT